MRHAEAFSAETGRWWNTNRAKAAPPDYVDRAHEAKTPITVAAEALALAFEHGAVVSKHLDTMKARSAIDAQLRRANELISQRPDVFEGLHEVVGHLRTHLTALETVGKRVKGFPDGSYEKWALETARPAIDKAGGIVSAELQQPERDAPEMETLDLQEELFAIAGLQGALYLRGPLPDRDARCELRIDRSALANIAATLVENAHQANPDRPPVLLLVRGGFAVISETALDPRVGDYLKGLGDPVSTKPDGHAKGLPLAIWESRKQGLDVYVRSDPGKASTGFLVVDPRNMEDPAPLVFSLASPRQP